MADLYAFSNTFMSSSVLFLVAYIYCIIYCHRKIYKLNVFDKENTVIYKDIE